MLVVNTNIASMRALRNLQRNSRAMQGTMARLSSGLRISSASDDPAGLGVAENLDAAERSMRVAMRNANDGLSMASVYDGGVTSITTMVKRIRALAIQSASETLDDDERAYVQDEYLELEDEIDRIAATLEFNGTFLSGDNRIDILVGIHGGPGNFIELRTKGLTAADHNISSGTIDLSTASGAVAALPRLDEALGALSEARSWAGAVMNRLDHAVGYLETSVEASAGAQSRIRDADYAYEAAQLSKQQIIQQAGFSVLSQANRWNEAVLQLLNP